MPDRIKHLTQDLANQIAAGEVVERPAAVLKELIENSIDAGATHITVRIEKGGTRLISVADNGIGMSRNDALLAFDRHATSKISSKDDLFNIRTMGFRGEALASIASVACVSLKTRESHENVGTFIEIEGGRLVKSTDAGCPEGTEIEVRDIFFNVPARRSFLKSPNTELGHMLNIVTHNALANKEVHFSIYDANRNNKTLLDLPPVKSLEDRVFQVYGRNKVDEVNDLTNVFFNAEGHTIYGLVSKPHVTFKNKENQLFFVNKRYIKNPTLSHAVQQAYLDLIPRDRNPMVILFIDMDPAVVDVNVHPSKREVRFKDSRYIHDITIEAIRESLRTKDSSYIADYNNPFISRREGEQGFRYETVLGDMLTKGYENVIPTQVGIQTHDIALDSRSPITTFGDKLHGNDGLRSRTTVTDNGLNPVFHVQELPSGPSIRILGQIGVLFIVAEIDGDLNIIDQHAAHERVIYDRLKRGFRNGGGEAQYLLIPETMELSLDKAQVLLQYIDFLGKIGFDIEEMGDRSFIIRSVPVVFSGEDKKALITDMVSEIVSADFSPGRDMKLVAIDDIIKALLSRKACHSAVRANAILSSGEMTLLIRDLLHTDMPYTCPHGRPVIKKFSFGDLAGMFGRK